MLDQNTLNQIDALFDYPIRADETISEDAAEAMTAAMHHLKDMRDYYLHATDADPREDGAETRMLSAELHTLEPGEHYSPDAYGHEADELRNLLDAVIADLDRTEREAKQAQETATAAAAHRDYQRVRGL